MRDFQNAGFADGNFRGCLVCFVGFYVMVALVGYMEASSTSSSTTSSLRLGLRLGLAIVAERVVGSSRSRGNGAAMRWYHRCSF